MTPREEFLLMVSDPESLYTYYIERMLAGQTLNDEQRIKFEYVETVVLGERTDVV